jgi:hypothetical protein
MRFLAAKFIQKVIRSLNIRRDTFRNACAHVQSLT